MTGPEIIDCCCIAVMFAVAVFTIDDKDLWPVGVTAAISAFVSVVGQFQP